MCGVIGLIHERPRADLGVIAGELLRTLEYRGYDSTGAAIQGDGLEVTLRKGVGAPSKLVETLGITRLAGQLLVAQVRWATFGAVDETNAQPHVVRCKTFMYGAHNGNVTNCDDLKRELVADGHAVRSDNDGEMVVHVVEHGFAEELEKLVDRDDPLARRAAMRRAIVAAGKRLRGSYAAVVADPVSRTLWAIKKGSSLYFGVGESDGSRFAIASSDLSAVLKLTRVLVPMSEGDFVEMEAARFQLHALADGRVLERQPVRSRLRAQDTALQAPFTTFMEQEIHAQIETTAAVVRAFAPPSAGERALEADVDRLPESDRVAMAATFERVHEQLSDRALAEEILALARTPAVAQLLERRAELRTATVDALVSSERAVLAELWGVATTPAERAAIVLLDASFARAERAEFRATVDAFTAAVAATRPTAGTPGGRVFVLSCGSSFHAAKTAALYFDAIAGVELLPLLPGEFRGQYGSTVRDGDVVVAVSQSGETKDLIDVLNDVIRGGRRVTRVGLVNNLNSTLAQEKCDIVIPLRCGPEIAVAATKSFVNQLAVFFGLAIEVGRRVGAPGVDARAETFARVPALVEETLRGTQASIAALAELLALRPSIHILATRLFGVAKEGALKVREVVLNHTEGFEASEFKHGPNTILGFNTVFGVDQLERIVSAARAEPGLDLAALLPHGYVDYPLVYVTGPDARDVDLTVSQMNTHKIRGAMTLVVAEEDAALRGAAEKPPADNPSYRSGYVVLPRTGDPLLTTFTATVALQRLALAMSLAKGRHLDARGVRDHGVHPDVPKNVSKSITVD
jgi:glucosamine 6-phosphate synthetase-like amidotransferase/phosphosugar isomerase protein